MQKVNIVKCGELKKNIVVSFSKTLSQTLNDRKIPTENKLKKRVRVVPMAVTCRDECCLMK